MNLNYGNVPSSPRYSDLRQLSKDDLAEILKQHQIWVDSEGMEGSLANFERTNLRGVSLVGLNLTQANFKEAYLYGAYLKKSNLQSANFSGVNLRSANLRWTNLQRATLNHANLMKADLLKADLRKADLSEVKYLQCEQLLLARIDCNTKLPSYIKITWASEESYDCLLVKE